MFTAVPVVSPGVAQVEVDWPSFLARHDLVFHVLPHQWNEGVFLGNGQLGLVGHATLEDNRFDFYLGRVDVTDHRQAPDKKTSRGVRGAGVMFDFPRLNIGRMTLRPAGKITGGSMRMDLWNAEVTGVIQTDRGEIHLRAVTLHERMANRLDVRSTERDEQGNPLPWKWEFLPGNPMTPRAQVFPQLEESKAYINNPMPVLTKLDDTDVCVQGLLAGGDYATAWKEQRTSPTEGTLIVTTMNEVPQAGLSAPLAVKTVQAALATLEADLAEHRSWWHEFYPQAFLSIPDARLETYYWIQIYKLASASRPDAPPIDVLGPFYRVSQWPGLWWNLNVQLTYWPAYAGNRLELGKNLVTEIDQNFAGLYESFRDRRNLGDFAWVMHNYWLQYRFAGDWEALRSGWMPKVKMIFADYVRRFRVNAQGQYELPNMESPEYEGFKTYDNPNYNLAILRWLCNAMLELDARFGGSDPEAARWRETLEKLVPYQVDENGLMIASHKPFAKSHRHYSHLLALYPLFQLNPDAPEDRELVIRSVKHWHHIGEGKGLAGYSFTGGASLYAALGMGDEALALLKQLLGGDTGISLVLPNTLYVESSAKNPVIETPLSAAASIMELLLQSWGGKIRVFPAVPSGWGEAQFHHLRAQGGFLVSAVRSGGKTRWVSVHSEAGEPCVVKVADWKEIDQPVAAGARPIAIKRIGQGEYALDVRKGETVLLRLAEEKNRPAVISPLPMREEERNLYGLREETRVKGKQYWEEVPLPSSNQLQP